MRVEDIKIIILILIFLIITNIVFPLCIMFHMYLSDTEEIILFRIFPGHILQCRVHNSLIILSHLTDMVWQ